MNLQLQNKIINIYENIVGKIYQKKYDAFYKKLYKLSKISYRYEIKYRNKINKCKISSKEKKDIMSYWKKYTKDYKVDAHKFYIDENGNRNQRFIPDDIFAKYIEQYFNNAKLAPAFADKNYFDLLLKGYRMPKTLVHYINGTFLDKKYKVISRERAIDILLKSKKFVVKESISTSGGLGVKVFESCNYKMIKDLIDNNVSLNLIFQEKIEQCSTLAKFNKTSINTIRIITYWFKNKIYVSNAVLRVGSNDSKIDNASSGGYFYHIDSNDRIILIARNILGVENTKISKKYKYNGEKLTFMDDVRKFVISAAMRLPHFKIIAWDIAISKDLKPILIEYNLSNNIPDITQMFAKPLFGDLTEDILNEVFNSNLGNKIGLKTDQYI